MLPALHHYRSTRHWLLAGVLALGIGGLFALPLIAGRGIVKDVAAYQLVFDRSLVVHVDLTIFVWFLAMTLLIWSLFLPPAANRMLRLPLVEGAAQILLYAATIVMAASFFAGGEGIKSNYIPVLPNPVFAVSIALLAATLALGVVLVLVSHRPWHLLSRSLGRTAEFEGALEIGAYGAAFITAVALWCFWQSFERLDSGLTGQGFYEYVFWAGGHIIQFTYAQVAMIAWAMLAVAAGVPLQRYPRLIAVLMIVSPLAVIPAFGFFRDPVTSDVFRQHFTSLMIHANGTAPSLLIATIIALAAAARKQTRSGSLAFIALASSIVVFLAGGALGLAIRGQNVTIPAHYHGSIVGLTLAFMGLAYLLLPGFGYADPKNWRLAKWQPVILATGQLLHVGGLAWSGGYGVLRKTVEAGGEMPSAVRISYGLIGGGGALALIGGVLFVAVVIRSLRGRHADNRLEPSVSGD